MIWPAEYAVALRALEKLTPELRPERVRLDDVDYILGPFGYETMSEHDVVDEYVREQQCGPQRDGRCVRAWGHWGDHLIDDGVIDHGL